MATKTQSDTQSQPLPELVTEMQAKTLDAVSAFTQANQRVMQELVELSTTAMKESVRTYAEIQSAALDAAREIPAVPGTRPDATTELRQDPFAWYQKSLLGAVDGTQRTLRLLEANAQILTRSGERLQASGQRAGKEIQEALSSCMSRMRDLSGRN